MTFSSIIEYNIKNRTANCIKCLLYGKISILNWLLNIKVPKSRKKRKMEIKRLVEFLQVIITIMLLLQSWNIIFPTLVVSGLWEFLIGAFINFWVDCCDIILAFSYIQHDCWKQVKFFPPKNTKCTKYTGVPIKAGKISLCYIKVLEVIIKLGDEPLPLLMFFSNSWLTDPCTFKCQFQNGQQWSCCLENYRGKTLQTLE